MTNMKDELREFLSAEEIQPPAELSQRILSYVKRDLDPPALNVFLKTLAIHFFTSLFTLSLCSQFGVRLFGTGPGLMAYFMRLGDMGCMAACGILFLGTTTFISGLILTHAEGKKLLRKWPIHLTLLSGFSLAFFLTVDAIFTLQSVIAWSLGAFLGAYILLRGSLMIRKATLSN